MSPVALFHSAQEFSRTFTHWLAGLRFGRRRTTQRSDSGSRSRHTVAAAPAAGAGYATTMLTGAAAGAAEYLLVMGTANAINSSANDPTVLGTIEASAYGAGGSGLMKVGGNYARKLWNRLWKSPAEEATIKALLNQGTRATELADQALLDKLKSRGFTIDQSSEIQRYLDYRRANAATFLDKDLLLRPDPRKIEVLEEYLHNVQRHIGLTDRMTPAQLEIHVKEFMLRHHKMLGISDADAGWSRNWLDIARGQ